MYSIGELVDKIVIENIKIATIKEKIHGKLPDDEQYAQDYERMMILNENRSILITLLDNKIEDVLLRKQKNRILKIVKTYG